MAYNAFFNSGQRFHSILKNESPNLTSYFSGLLLLCSKRKFSVARESRLIIFNCVITTKGEGVGDLVSPKNNEEELSLCVNEFRVMKN